MKKTFCILAALLLLALAFHAAAQIPRTLSYQGVLTDAAGKPRPNNSYEFTFRLYDVATGGTALWTEQKTLPVNNGLFATALGDQVAFGAAVKFDRQYWLGIQVGNEPELSPRIALTSVGYSMSSLRADTAMVAMATSADTTWRHKGSDIYWLNGNVGVGTMNPSARLEAVSDNDQPDILKLRNSHTGTSAGAGVFLYADNSLNGGLFQAGSAYSQLSDLPGGGAGMLVLNAGGTSNGIGLRTGHPSRPIVFSSGGQALKILNGYVGIGVGSGAPAFPLHVANNQSGGTYVAGFTKAESGPGYINFLGGSGGGRTYFEFNSDYFGIYTSNNAQTSWHSFSIDGTNGIMSFNGRTKTNVLEITGGMDLAEPFPTSEAESLPLGAVVVIDENNSGHLKLSRQPYDKGVAGIVSGAGGINPGLTLRQEGVMEAGQLVALTGKVYALATAANGHIKPGDRLTTSAVPGHCMKATDSSLCDGAVIGKAMSSLETGEGLVLVLVNLQ